MDVVTQFCRWISEQAEGCIQGRVRSDPGVKSAWSGEEEALPVWWPTWSLEHGPKENCWRAKVVSRTLLSVDYFCSHKTCVKWPERCQLQQWVRKNLPLESLRPDVWSLKICVKTWKNILKWSALKMLRWQMGKYKVSNFWTAVRPHTMNANWVCEYFLQHGKQRTHLEPVRTKRAACMWTRVGGLICAVLCCAPELCSLLVYPGRRAESWTPGHATLLHSRHSSCSVCLESPQALQGSVPSKSPSVICNEICLCARRRQWGQIIQLHN